MTTDKETERPPREKLLEAAAELFVAHGYDGTGLSEILKQAGVSKGGFYHHFPTKLALYDEVIQRFFPFPFSDFDWEAHTALTVREQKRAIDGYYAQVVVSASTLSGGPTRALSLFFDSLDRLPAYRESARDAYRKLVYALAVAVEREGTAWPSAWAEAVRFIAEQEGGLYLWAVTGGLARPEDPAESS